MKISIDTKEDSHEEIKKVIKMLQNLVGDQIEIFTNEPSIQNSSPIANIFGDASNEINQEPTAGQATEQAQAEESSESAEDLFAELFSEEELKKMNTAPVKGQEDEEEQEEIKPKKKNYDIEFY